MELKNRVEQISATMLELRQFTEDGPKTRQLLDSLFRSVHSLKAAAATNGYDDLSRIAHEFENLLHSLRTGKVRLDDDVLRVFSDTADAFLASVKGQPSSFSLNAVSQFTSASESVDTETLLNMIPAEIRASLKDEERHRAAEAIREGSTLEVVEAVFDVSDFDSQFRNLKEQLNKTGEVISTAAKVDDDRADQIRFKILYAAKAEKIPVDWIFQQAIRAGTSTATALGKEINFVIKGGDLLLDRSLCEALADPLVHLVRNAVDHGIESHGNIIIEATTSSGQTLVTVTDDGRGIDPANLPLLFQPGFSTATDVTEISGRGVGLDVVATAVNEVGGTVAVKSEPGKGTTFEIKLPL